MDFTNHQKDIIRLIASEDITDIVSYINFFGLSTLRKLDKDQIEERFKKETAGKTYKKLKDDFSILTKNDIDPSTTSSNYTYHKPTDDDYEYIPLEIVYPRTEYRKTLTDSSYFSYDYFEGINTVNSFSDIKDFLAIWQYLKNEGLILEVEKKITKKDYELFFEYVPFNETSYKKSIDIAKANGFQSMRKLGEPGNATDYRNYSDYLFEYNTTHELICSQFLGKQIYGTSELDVFIKSKFKTKNDKQFWGALIAAYIGNGISFIGIIISLLMSFFSTDTSDIKQIQQQLSEIQENLEENNSLTSTELRNISDQLKEISESGINDSKLDELVNEILQKTNPQ